LVEAAHFTVASRCNDCWHSDNLNAVMVSAFSSTL
jgi:hypothetical protein